MDDYMQEYKAIVSRMRLSTYPILVPVIFMAVFSTIWATVIMINEPLLFFIATIPFAIFVFLLIIFIKQLKLLNGSLHALREGREAEGEIYSTTSSIASSNNNRMVGLKVRYTNVNGLTVESETMAVYYASEVRQLEQMGKVRIRYCGKFIFVTEQIEMFSALATYSAMMGERDKHNYDYEYNYEREERSKKKERAAEPRYLLLGLVKQGNETAKIVSEIEGRYEQLKYCALNDVPQEVRDAIEGDMDVLTDTQHMQEAMNFYRGLRADITTVELDDAIKLVDFFDYFLESPETEHLISLVLEESKKIEPYMLASRTVRKLKQYRLVEEVASQIKTANSIDSVLDIIRENHSELGNLVSYIGAVARSAAKTNSDIQSINATLSSLGGE